MNKKILVPTLLSLGLMGVQNGYAEDISGRGFYVGVFGGGTVSDNNKFSQSGVAYHQEGELFQGQSAPTKESSNLLVNVLGSSASKAGAIGGIHAGYEWNELPIGSNWGILPAVELEGYYLGSTIAGTLSNPRPEPEVLAANGTVLSNKAVGTHVFSDTFNLDTGVLLTNAVFAFKTPWSNRILPYIGGGVGAAINGFSNAQSAQLGPAPEFSPYINHFNGNPDSTTTSFATQAKAGIRAKVFDHVSVFAEYRYLFVTQSNAGFGSTVYPGVHSETSTWNVNFGSMNYHSGVFGIEYNF
jgi:opacity protein-like surface antigen